MCDEMSLEEYGRRYHAHGGMDDGFAWALHHDLFNRSETMERVLKQAHGMLYEQRAEIDRMRDVLARIIRDADRAKNSNWITRSDAIEHIMRLARYAEDAINPPNTTVGERST